MRKQRRRMGLWAALGLAAALWPAPAFGGDGPPDPVPPASNTAPSVPPAATAPSPTPAAEPSGQAGGKRRPRRKGADGAANRPMPQVERLRDRLRNRQRGDQ